VLITSGWQTLNIKVTFCVVDTVHKFDVMFATNETPDNGGPVETTS